MDGGNTVKSRQFPPTKVSGYNMVTIQTSVRNCCLVSPTPHCRRLQTRSRCALGGRAATSSPPEANPLISVQSSSHLTITAALDRYIHTVHEGNFAVLYYCKETSMCAIVYIIHIYTATFSYSSYSSCSGHTVWYLDHLRFSVFAYIPSSVLDKARQQFDGIHGNRLLPRPHREVKGHLVQEERTQPVT